MCLPLILEYSLIHSFWRLI